MKNNNTELTVRIISTILMLIAISLLFVGLRKVAIIVFVVVLALDIAGIVIASKMDKNSITKDKGKQRFWYATSQVDR